jgi:hypothetical protein
VKKKNRHPRTADPISIPPATKKAVVDVNSPEKNGPNTSDMPMDVISNACEDIQSSSVVRACTTVTVRRKTKAVIYIIIHCACDIKN